MRWFTPAGTASRTARRSAARRRSCGSASSASARTPAHSSTRQKCPSGLLPGVAGRALPESARTPGGVGLGAELQLHEQRERRPVGYRDVVSRVAPSSRRISSDRRSMCSIAHASSPSAAPVCHVAIDASRSALTSASPCASAAHGIHASTMFGAGESVLKVICGDDAERPFRSDEEIDEVHVGRGVISGRSLRHVAASGRSAPAPIRARVAVSISNAAVLARAAPRAAASSTVPSARTTVSASTQSRVLPYLKVAAPAAFVATMPPAKAPVNVGTGGNHAPASASRSCIAATVTPGSTVMRPGPTSMMRAIFVVARMTSPIGVAPPVREDWAPIGRTAEDVAQDVDDIGGRAGEDNAGERGRRGSGRRR